MVLQYLKSCHRPFFITLLHFIVFRSALLLLISAVLGQFAFAQVLHSGHLNILKDIRFKIKGFLLILWRADETGG